MRPPGLSRVRGAYRFGSRARYHVVDVALLLGIVALFLLGLWWVFAGEPPED